ncbi:MAG: hypothetical protein ACN6N0_05265, partial [Microvirgula sp.]
MATLPSPTRHPERLVWSLLLATSLLLPLLGASLGGDEFRWPDLTDPIFTTLRLPRIAAALLVGASVAA